MTWLSDRTFALVLLTALVIGCCAIVAQSPKKEQQVDPAVLADAPHVPQMVVDSDGRLHFGPRTVPPPALESEARTSYTRQVLRRAQTSAARDGLAFPGVSASELAQARLSRINCTSKEAPTK